MTYSIAEYAPEDAPLVADMWRVSGRGWPGGSAGPEMSADLITRQIRETRNLAIFVVHAEGKIVGWCNLTRSGTNPHHAYIAILNVDPDFHGRGVGRDLLRAGFDRALALDFRRLDLHTWPGNHRAMPLYKRMGFFWIPDTSVHMANFLPTVIRASVVENFLGDLDWYRALRQPLAMTPDDHKIDDRPIYRYLFVRDNRQLRIVVDRGAEEILAAELVSPDESGADYAIGLVAPRQIVVGDQSKSISARCTIETASIRVGPGAIWTDDALSPVRRVIHVVTDRVDEAAELDLHGNSPGEGRVRAEVLVDNRPLHLAAAVDAVTPLAVIPHEKFLVVRPDEQVWFAIDVQNNTGAARPVVLRALVDDALEVEVETNPAQIEPSQRSTFSVGVRARRTGHHRLRLEPGTADLASQAEGVDLNVAAPGFGEIIAFATDDGAVLAGEHVRVSVARVGGEITLARPGTRSGGRVRPASGPPDGERTMATMQFHLGPPYRPSETDHRDGRVSISLGSAVPEIRHVVSLPDPPGVEVERRITLASDGRLRLAVLVYNGSSESITPTGRWAINMLPNGHDQPRLVFPLRQNLVVAPQVNFPDWSSIANVADEFAENWLAREHDSSVVGVHWAACDHIEWGHWRGAMFDLTAEAILPDQHRALAPIEVWGGRGDWRVARAQWYSTPGDHLTPSGALRVGARPPVVVLSGDGARCEIMVESERLQPAEAEVDLMATDGSRLTDSAFTLPEISRGRPGKIVTTIQRQDDEPGIGVLTARAVTNVDAVMHSVPIIRLARVASPCVVDEIDEGSLPLIRVDNGWTTFRIAPHFAGAVIGWERNGVNHLFTAYPTPDNYAWFGPWYGGIHPYVGQADEQGLPGTVGRLAPDSFSWEPLPWRPRKARRWCGTRLRTNSTALPWLRGEVEYLTLLGSNLLLATLTLTNAGTSRQQIKAGFNAFVQPGGTRASARLHWSPNRTPYVPKPFQADWLSTGNWAAVEGNGATISATVLSTAVHLGGIAIGESGTDLFASSQLTLDREQTVEVAVLFALARDADEARRYHLLAGADL